MTSNTAFRSSIWLRLLPWFLLLLVSLPVLELLATIWLVKQIGWWVLAWYIASAAVGVLILKSWRLSVAFALFDGARQGGVPLGRLFWVLRSLLAALLFIFPGPISDVLGILLILPWPGHNATLGPRNAEDIIEGEFVRMDEHATAQAPLDSPRLPRDQ
jgi:UPF0716 protein FxsA